MIEIEVCNFFMSIANIQKLCARVNKFVVCVPPVGGWVDPDGVCNTGPTRIVRSSATEICSKF